MTRSGSSGSFGSTDYASDSSEEVGPLDIGIDGDGYATATYSAEYGSGDILRARDFRSTTPQTISGVQSSSSNVAVAVNSDNEAMGAWAYQDEILVTARGESDAAFGSASNIADESTLTSLSGADITVHSDGSAVAAWLGQDGSGNTLVEVARYRRHLTSIMPPSLPTPIVTDSDDEAAVDAPTSGSSTSSSSETVLSTDTSSSQAGPAEVTSSSSASSVSVQSPSLASSSITLKLSVPKQKAAKRGKLLVYLTCVGGPCKAALTGKCKVGKKSYTVKLAKQLSAGKKTKTYLKMSKKLRKNLRRAVRKRKRITLRLSAKASGISGAKISGNLTAKKTFRIKN